MYIIYHFYNFIEVNLMLLLTNNYYLKNNNFILKLFRQYSVRSNLIMLQCNCPSTISHFQNLQETNLHRKEKKEICRIHTVRQKKKNHFFYILSIILLLQWIQWLKLSIVKELNLSRSWLSRISGIGMNLYTIWEKFFEISMIRPVSWSRVIAS